MAIKILHTRRSSRNAEIEYRIVENDSGEIVCNCPACWYGGECYHAMKIRSQREYQKQLAVKHLLIDKPLPSMRDLIKQQWDYILGRKVV